MLYILTPEELNGNYVTIEKHYAEQFKLKVEQDKVRFLRDIFIRENGCNKIKTGFCNNCPIASMNTVDILKPSAKFCEDEDYIDY